ncbi:RES family NAD+ phosphorylase [Parasediminibacterium sp. JCM 36343]|uniref:RES family NAD+ phosphorylase n=1 Tax=Parasediminibacterium sp. JCM 36343 TaxID=3374279 RepID=UPI00397D0A4C
MEVFRIASEAYSRTLSCAGTANRWNLKGQNVLYTAASRSLASLELIVHKGAVKPALLYKVMVISIADDDYLTKQIQIKDLPINWRSFAAYSVLQNIGADWYNKQDSLILKVPSAIILNEYNYMINTEHPDFSSKVSFVRTEDYFWDSRLM